MGERVPDSLPNRAHDRIAQIRHTVVNPETLASGLDQARFPKIGEVARGSGLRDSQALVDVADADFAGQQEAEDPAAGSRPPGP